MNIFNDIWLKLSILDVINGCFELFGGILIWANVQKLYHDKMIRGTNWTVTGFFWLWGIYNTLYYPSLHQWVSFIGGLMIVLANTAWMILALKYRKN